MKVAAVIPLCQRFGTVQLSAFVSVVSLIHIAQTGNKFKAVLSDAQLTDTAFCVCIIELIHAFFIAKFPVKCIFRRLACDAFLYFLVLHFIRK